MRNGLFFALVLLMITAAAACANPVLFAPSGTTLSTGQVRAEAAFSPSNDHGSYYWLATGLMQLEVNVIRVDKPDADPEDRIGAQWNFLPETFVTPAVGFGVTDVTSESAEGIGVYVAATKSLPTSKLPIFLGDLRGTLGIGAGGIKGPFASIEAQLPLGLFAQAEYDSHDFNAAFGIQPIKLLRLKAYTLRNDFFFGAELRPISF